MPKSLKVSKIMLTVKVMCVLVAINNDRIYVYVMAVWQSFINDVDDKYLGPVRSTHTV